MNLRRDQTRIPLLGAMASFVFLTALALTARSALRRVTFADLDEELQTLSVAIGSDLELQGVDALQFVSLPKGVESNVLAFRLERHSAMLLQNGKVVAVAGDLVRQHKPQHAEQLARRAEGTFTAVEPFSGLAWRCRFRVSHLSGAARGATLIVFRSIEPTLRALERADRALLMFVLAGVAGSWAIITIAVRRALRPVEEVTAIAERVHATDLSHRVNVTTGGTEVERLRGVINSLFDRLAHSFEAQRRFIADAAHELKTPAATILAESQEAMRSDTAPEIRAELLESIGKTARSMAAGTDDLLTLARGESARGEFVRVDLSEVAAAAVERHAAVKLTHSGKCVVDGDPAALQRAIANLISNALRYGPEGSPVDVRVTGDEHEVSIEVSDHGPGIPESERAQIFERFVRLPHARLVNPDGSGLGLAIVAQTVANHGGTVAVENAPGGGARFRISLRPTRVDATMISQ